MSATICPIILAGGASSRLWPVSDHARPKWDLRLFGERSLLEGAWDRARDLAPPERGRVVAGNLHVQKIRKSLSDLPTPNLMVEPEARDTSGAVAFALGAVLRETPNGVLLILPGDHLISPISRFTECARTAAELAVRENALVTMGIIPREPSSAYGYVQAGKDVAKIEGIAKTNTPRVFLVEAFREKPDRATAEAYLKSGNYFWNAGIFAFPAQLLLKEFERQLPGHAAMAKALASAKTPEYEAKIAAEHFPKLKKISIDFGVMEHAEKVASVAVDFSWDDIGSWTSVRDKLAEKGAHATGPRTRVDHVGSKNNLVLAPGQRVALVGVENLAVIHDSEGLLICHLEQDQDVREVSKAAPKINVFEVKAKTQGREIDVLVAEPPVVNEETGFLLMLHGYGSNRKRYVNGALERWCARYNVVCIVPEYRDSGFDFDPVGGQGVKKPYDFSHLQVCDALNAYQTVRMKYPQANAKRSIIWGSSQGGHIALLASAFAQHTFSFTFAASTVALITHTFTEEYMGRKLTNDELAIREAPRWISRVNAPVALVHGTADGICIPKHSQEVAVALVNAGKDVSLKFIPGGDHALEPVTTIFEQTELIADEALHFATRSGIGDDFERKSKHILECPGGTKFTLDFSNGVAQWV